MNIDIMSDALSAIARDQSRGEAISRLIKTILEYFSPEFKSENKEAIEKAAEDVDSIRGGYFSSGRTTYSQHILGIIEKAENGNEEEKQIAWGILLKFSREEIYFDKLKELSPYKGQMIMFARIMDNGMPRVSEMEISNLVRKIILEQEKDFETGDTLIVSLPEYNPSIKKIEGYS